MTRVLLAEDDSQIAKSLKISLELEGFELHHAGTVASAWDLFSREPFDLLLLDVGLPDGSGIELCQRIRAQGREVPILFLSARVDEETVVKGIRSGGDDYIRKPFGIEELKARMGKMLQRAGTGGLSARVLEAGPLSMNLEKRAATLQGRALSLGKREFDILALLARKPGDVITRDHILTNLDEKSEVYDRTIDSHISHLRRKMREIAGEAMQISSVYGVGYRLDWVR